MAMSNQPSLANHPLRWIATGLCIAALLAGCATKPPPPPPPPPTTAPTAKPAPVPVQPAPPPMPSGKVSSAGTPRDYRKDAASHLYERNGGKIFPGKLPPLLYAVGVLQVEIDGRGNVTGLSWMRKPSHAPEVVAEIERAIHEASPFPAPLRMGRVIYTDTWLWHKSGRFQLDTLTEGQI
jgi:protein TonB